jgi:hypothetical protein
VAAFTALLGGVGNLHSVETRNGPSARPFPGHVPSCIHVPGRSSLAIEGRGWGQSGALKTRVLSFFAAAPRHWVPVHYADFSAVESLGWAWKPPGSRLASEWNGNGRGQLPSFAGFDPARRAFHAVTQRFKVELGLAKKMPNAPVTELEGIWRQGSAHHRGYLLHQCLLVRRGLPVTLVCDGLLGKPEHPSQRGLDLRQAVGRRRKRGT